uniref:Uncharacterized protein n=1 Tax=Oryza punctata TaxID=4537 RepID=A0A0E0KB79_ORYPU
MTSGLRSARGWAGGVDTVGHGCTSGRESGGVDGPTGGVEAVGQPWSPAEVEAGGERTSAGLACIQIGASISY